MERKSESLRDERTSVKRELEEERRRLVEANIQTEDNRKKKEAVLRSIEENQAELEATKVRIKKKSLIKCPKDKTTLMCTRTKVQSIRPDCVKSNDSSSSTRQTGAN